MEASTAEAGPVTAAGIGDDDRPTVATPRVRPGPRSVLLRRVPFTRRGLIAAAVVLGAGVAYWYLCWIQSSALSSSSDSATIALQGWDMGHHNPKLRHWITGDAPFYTLETPLYAIVERLIGLSANTLHVVASLTYTLVMLAAAWLARGDARGVQAYARFGLVAAFLAVPLWELALSGTLLESPDHIGTSVFLLLGFLLYDRVADWRWAKWCLFGLLVLGEIGDATVKYVAVPTFVIVAAARVLASRRLRSPDLWMGIAAAASVPGAATLRAALRTWGAYSMVPPHNKAAKPDVWLGHLHSTLLGLLKLFNIDVADGTMAITKYWQIGVLLGALVLAAGAYGFVRTLVRWPKADAADQLLTVGIPVYLGVFTVSTMVLPKGNSAYEFLGVIPMIAVLGARNLPLPAGPRRFPYAVPAVSGLVALVLLASGIRPAVVLPQQTVAAWLKAHGYTYGISGYWDAAETTVASDNTVGVRAVYPGPNHQFSVYAWVTKTTWYDPAKYDANFFIADPSKPGLRETDVVAAYGQPEAVYTVWGKQIMIYRINLLTNLNQAQPPNF